MLSLQASKVNSGGWQQKLLRPSYAWDMLRWGSKRWQAAENMAGKVHSLFLYRSGKNCDRTKGERHDHRI